MNDDIQLPPMPPKPPVTDPDAAMQAYGRACYKAGVVIGERRAKGDAKGDAKPVVHKAMLSLGQNGSWSCYPPSVHRESTIVTLCWTDDGRAWIDSEKNRGLATELRLSGMSIHCHFAADALDGGVR